VAFGPASEWCGLNLIIHMMVINSRGQEKKVENSDTGALAVTRDYPRILSVDILTIRIIAIFSRIRISRILSEDTIRIPVSVVNTAADSSRGVLWSTYMKLHESLSHIDMGET
jgi:hypothetical protein